MRKWEDLIAGTITTVFTDHKPLIGAFRNTTPQISDKQQRQLSFISEYISDIVYISGKDNVVADTLSRSFKIGAIEDEHVDVVDLPKIAKVQGKDSQDYSIYTAFDIGIPNTPLYCSTSQPN